MLALRFSLRLFYFLACCCSRPTLLFPFVFLFYTLRMFLVLWGISVQPVIFLYLSLHLSSFLGICPTYMCLGSLPSRPYLGMLFYCRFFGMKVHLSTIDSRDCSASLIVSLHPCFAFPSCDKNRALMISRPVPRPGRRLEEGLSFRTVLCARSTVNDFVLELVTLPSISCTHRTQQVTI